MASSRVDFWPISHRLSAVTLPFPVPAFETTGEDRRTGSRDFKRKRTAASARTLTEKDADKLACVAGGCVGV